MAASRTGVSTLRQILRHLCRIVAKFPGLLVNPDVPLPISAAVAALVGACLADEFDDPGAGEITGQGATS
jgi:hypothetical protein